MRRIVGFSGGIDSQAVSLYVRRRYPAEEIILLNSTAGGNEHPLTTAWLAAYSRDVFPVQQVDALVADWLEHYSTPGTHHHDAAAKYPPETPMTMELLSTIKGTFPFSGMRFCTEYLKSYPQRRWMRENIPVGESFDRYSGVRRDESKGRADTPFLQHDDFYDCDLHSPLADWTKAMCFEYIRAAGEEVNPLYKMGMSRVGCSTCVCSGKEEIREWAARFPEEVARVRGMEERTGLPYFRFKVKGKDAFVDQVVKWSRTERGGERLTLPFVEADADAGTCSSKYGLCE
jgi:3'-phosphoadenosine 5'-phosphosulfate sulfotransferase (PAPS reductase)/FAD synthetase